MQTTFNFNNKSPISVAFFNFAQVGNFNFFTSFAFAQNTFINLKLEEENFNQITNELAKSNFQYVIKGNTDYLSIKEGLVFVNLPSFLTKNFENELLFLDISRTLISKGISFIGLSNSRFSPQFALPDLRSRFESSLKVSFEDEAKLDFHLICAEFLRENGIFIKEDVLSFMMSGIERTSRSFSLFVAELKRFVETNKVKIKRSHFEEILQNYEKARNQANF
jgi:hypothetical protein